jgi:hypothetical protein
MISVLLLCYSQAGITIQKNMPRSSAIHDTSEAKARGTLYGRVEDPDNVCPDPYLNKVFAPVLQSRIILMRLRSS